MNKVPSIESMKALRDAFEHDLPEMIQRFEQITKNRIGHDYMTLSLADKIYLEEAYYCYIHGHYIAFLLMLAVSFEITLRRFFDEKRFKNLINQAQKNDLITAKEANEIHWLRNFKNTIHMVDHVIPTHRKQNYEIDFYNNTYEDVIKMAKKGLKLIPVITRIHINSFYIFNHLLSEDKIRPPADTTYLEKKYKSSQNTRSKNIKTHADTQKFVNK